MLLFLSDSWIMVLGGYFDVILDSVELFNVQTRQRTLTEKLPIPLAGAGEIRES